MCVGGVGLAVQVHVGGKTGLSCCAEVLGEAGPYPADMTGHPGGCALTEGQHHVIWAS